ncbi:orotidine-5'-phosphate decarboxylase [Alicyclobacillus macrosporangiidus]|uniref:orotidine-5'-phosphate decarboxylase n=1 Tax=Alicyclobacillus macrosporangiidus TaxID=392015 RepID=UPI000ABC9FB1|nr:orotidine-5'-phosphate decarboxylase [Alicyclobacillus macrosporangiidus]
MSEALQTVLCEPRYDGVRRATYVALDVPTWTQAEALVHRFGPAVDGYKVGLELFFGDGPVALSALRSMGKRVFLDVKLHDIPNTVAGALRAIARFEVEMVNVHASGGPAMLMAAREALDQAAGAAGAVRPLLLAVTVLTSLGTSDLQALGWGGPQAEPEALVERWAGLAARCGLDGVVASALEARRIRAAAPPGFEIVVPGTRPAGAPRHDQVRSLTPGEAMKAGATRLVLGRAVTRADDPLAALASVWDEMAGV